MSQELKGVKSSREMTEFLEKHIRWNVFVQTENINSGSNPEMPNKFTHPEECSQTSNTINTIFSHELCNNCHNTADKENDSQQCRNLSSITLSSILENYSEPFITMGVLSLLGNLIALIYEIKTLIQLSKRDAKEVKVYNMLVLNLCLADVLMAIYLIVLPNILKNSFRPERAASPICDALGVTSVLSLQVSMSILVIISAYRLFSVLYPYKHIHMKVSVILIVLVWFIWLFVAIVPLLNETVLAHGFTRRIMVCPKGDNVCKFNERSRRRSVQKITRNVQLIENGLVSENNSYSQVIKRVNEYQTNEVALQLLNSFNLVDMKCNDVYLIDYYSSFRACTVDLFFTNSNPIAIKAFSLTLITSSLAGYFFILIAYLIMLKHISSSRTKNLIPCMRIKVSPKQARREPQMEKIKNENKQVYIRILVICVTDVICGIIVCVVGLLHYLDSIFTPECSPSNFKCFKQLAPIIVIVFFPLNSVINPYIYCFHLLQNLLKCCKTQVNKMSSTIQVTISSLTDNSTQATA